MTMVFVPAGEFGRGSICWEMDCYMQTTSKETLQAFWVDKTEISNAMYKKCIEQGECTSPARTDLGSMKGYFGNSNYDNYPVVFIDWEQAYDYCRWTGKRLPTDAEWEKAARGTDGRRYTWGNVLQGFEANFCDKNCPFSKNEPLNDGYAYTAPVDAYKEFASPYGAINMSGNVGELDSNQEVHGGGWNTVARGLWTFTKLMPYSPENIQIGSIGFRCVIDANP
jgi:serine/threonine-protein kinase